ncbi:MAG: putative manganese transporter [Pseudomonadota bacterium]
MNVRDIASLGGTLPDMSVKDRAGRTGIVLGLLALACFGDEATKAVFWETVSSAYITVTVFVAMTLLFFYSVEHFLKVDLSSLLEKHKSHQILIAALLGALPGCGGAIIVVTQYSIGRAGFGAIVAVLTSTMGDAAFLLLAKEPLTGLAIVSLSIVVGFVSGHIVEFFHGYDFLAVKTPKRFADRAKPFEFGNWKWPWVIVFIPGIAMGLMSAFQVDIDAVFRADGAELFIGSIGAILSLALWFINPSTAASFANRTEEQTLDFVWDKTITDASFVTVWVVIAFLLFEMTILWTGWDLNAAFARAGLLAPIMGVAIGLLPGCGPQVLTTTLYLQGAIPLSAQLGNAISNDGDALFPALAVAPRASIIATIYTAVPALIVALSYSMFIER